MRKRGNIWAGRLGESRGLGVVVWIVDMPPSSPPGDRLGL